MQIIMQSLYLCTQSGLNLVGDKRNVCAIQREQTNKKWSILAHELLLSNAQVNEILDY